MNGLKVENGACTSSEICADRRLGNSIAYCVSMSSFVKIAAFALKSQASTTRLIHEVASGFK